MADNNRKTLTRPVFVLGCHKSGTTLLCCLLDAHADLFVLPLEMHLLQFSGYRMNYPLRRDMPAAQDNRKVRIAETVRNLRRVNRTGQSFGAGRLDGKADLEAFEQRLRSAPWSDDAEFIHAAVTAAHESLTGRPLPPGGRVVEKSVENAGMAGQLRRLMPDCSFIHIVRNPYASAVAIRRSMSYHGYPRLGRILFSIRNSMEALDANAKALQPYKVVRFEDLIMETPAVMRGVAEFLGIEFRDSLLSPTRMGQPWGGNSTSGQQFGGGISQAPLTNWRKDILPIEIALVNRILGPMLDRFGYEKLPTPSQGLYRRAAGEGLWRYIGNRLLLRR